MVLWSQLQDSSAEPGRCSIANQEQAAESIFGEALELGPEERQVFLDRICLGQPALRSRVEALLKENDRLQGFLSEPPFTPSGRPAGEDLPKGTQLGRYTIVEPLGSGGMGQVFRAVNANLQRDAAVKVLHPELAGDTGLVTRFRREARALAALNHPNICTIFEIGEQDGLIFIAMEFLDGLTLRQRMANQRLELESTLTLSIQIADGLDAAHSAGIVHRDITPGNIFITRRGHVKILDFGVAKVAGARPSANASTASADHATLPGSVMGTVAYMSPEQVRGKEVDARSDLFSFGVVLYQVATGLLPFRGDSPGLIFDAILNRAPAPLLRVNPDLPAALEEIVGKALEKSPDLRYHHAADMRIDLMRLKRSLEPGHHESMGEVRSALEQVAVSKPAEPQPSIAVLPFANMSADKENEYFSDGLAEEILNLLAKMPGLKVIARTSSFSFRGKDQDIRKIAQALGVQNILEGSVRRAGNRIRVTAELIHAADGAHLWSERYDRELADVFAVQDEISAAIAQELQLKLSPRADAKPRYTPKLPAWEALLKARHFHWKVTRESMDQAKVFYEQAIALDPQFALAQAQYADYLYGRTTLDMTPLREAAPVARALAQRALELDPSLPEAHAVLGALAGCLDYNWNEAGRQLALATADDSDSPHCHFTRGLHYFLSLGRRKEAVEQVEIALRGDPLQLMIRSVMGMCLDSAGRHAEAEEHLRQTVALDPNFSWAWYLLAGHYAARQMFAEALPFAEKAFSLAPWWAPSVGVYAALLVRTGARDRGLDLIQRLGSGEAYGASKGLALFYLCCGEIDRAADWFEKAIEERYPRVPSTLQGAIAEPLRASPRWPKLAALMNLPTEAS